MLESLGYTIKQAFKQVGRNRTMSLASVFSITAMLLILGIFFILVVNINVVVESVKDDYDTVEIYLLDEAEDYEIEAVADQARSVEGVSDVTYKSKEEAMESLKEKWGDQAYLLDDLANNPLPASLVVHIEDIESAGDVVKAVDGMDGIEQVNYFQDTVDKLLKVTNFIQMSALVIMIFLIVVCMVVVSNTIKLTVFARQKEIQIMKYIGATDWFVRGPFLVEGILLGIISSAVSVALVAVIYKALLNNIGSDMLAIISAPMVPLGFLISNAIVIFLVLGVSIGACGSIVSMRKFLDV